MFDGAFKQSSKKFCWYDCCSIAGSVNVSVAIYGVRLSASEDNAALNQNLFPDI